MEFAYNYYPLFACIGSACKHNCCIGWEIDIDKSTYRKYFKFGSPYKKLLKGCVKKGQFIKDKDGRCALLNDKNLCKIVCQFGNDGLCQVCADHPRFRNYFSDFNELGLGLCCEEATKKILGFKKTIKIEKNHDLKKLTSLERQIITFRQEVFSILQNREKSIMERIKGVEKLLGFCVDESQLFDFLFDCEMLDKNWKNTLNMQKNAKNCDFLDMLSLPLEQLIVYFVSRHISVATDNEDLITRTIFCIFATKTIINLLATSVNRDFDSLCELSRTFSAEIEYSDDNLAMLLDRCQEYYYREKIGRKL